MMYDLAVDGLRLLSELEVAMASGGYQPNMPGEGGGGPSEAEVAIENMYSNWGSSLYYGDEYSAIMNDGTHFFDTDQNGYYDYAERGAVDGVWVYDPDTNDWAFRPYSAG